MIIDNKGKLFGKVSIIDIIIVLVVIAAIAGVGYKYATSKTVSPLAKQDTVLIQLYAPEVPDYVADKLKVGDYARDMQFGPKFGKIVDVKLDKSVVYGEDNNGQTVTSTKEFHKSVLITVEASGIYSDTGVNIDNVEYVVWKSVFVGAGNVEFWYKLTNLEKKE